MWLTYILIFPLELKLVDDFCACKVCYRYIMQGVCVLVWVGVSVREGVREELHVAQT